ncbi:MAG: hypothetical protein AAB339_07325, partial [Elusimicrobiota bacterium]
QLSTAIHRKRKEAKEKEDRPMTALSSSRTTTETAWKNGNTTPINNTYNRTFLLKPNTGHFYSRLTPCRNFPCAAAGGLV